MTDNMAERIQVLKEALSYSCRIASEYESLMTYSINDNEDSPEFEEHIENIKKLLPQEVAAYNKIKLKYAVDYLKSTKHYFTNGHKISTADIRSHNRMLEKSLQEANEDEPDNALISDMINSNITVNGLKNAIKRIESMEDNNPIVYKKLITYHNIYKYIYLTANTYIESLAINANFNIEEIKCIRPEDIPSLSKHIKPIVFLKIFSEISQINGMNFQDKFLNTYQALVSLSKIEIMLEMLDERTLDKVISKLNSQEESEAIKEIKELALKRKKRFTN